MDVSLEESYFVWLYEQVGVQGTNPHYTYWNLLRKMHSMEFWSRMDRDDARVEDGLELRNEFGAVLDEGCSFLEMMIGLSRRMAFQGEGMPVEWFWHLVENLDMMHYVDASWLDHFDERCDEIFTQINNRTYAKSGKGGLFPLRHPAHDQRGVEMWYQMHEYMMELSEVSG